MERQRTIRRRTRSTRNAFTLVELVVNMVSASVLVAGLASALLLCMKTLPTDTSASADNNRASKILAQIAEDVQHATGFTEQTANAVTFTVPDRDGDSKAETIRYFWSGTAGQPLKYQYNATTSVDLAANVQSLNFTKLNRVIAATSSGPAVTYNVGYEAFSEAKVGVDNTQITIPVPAGTVDDRLLIACVALDGNVMSTVVPPAGWTQLVLQNYNGEVGLGVWWRFSSSEPGNYQWNWTGGEQAYGWIMRFSNISPTAPINAVSVGTGTSLLPACPGATTSTDNTMILRIAAIDSANILVDTPVMLLHTNITLDRSNTNANSVSGGTTYATQATAGTVGAATYTLSPLALLGEEFVTATIAIAPYPPQQ
jgi:hypothetical protein